MRSNIVKKIQRPNSTILDAAYYSWANPSDDGLESEDFPFVFDVRNYKIQEPRVDSVVVVQLAAFAYELESYSSVEEFDRSQRRSGIAGVPACPWVLSSPRNL